MNCLHKLVVKLVVGGYFTSVDGNSISANNIASWDGNSWATFGTESNNEIYAIAMNSGGDSYFIGGKFTTTPDGFCGPYLLQCKISFPFLSLMIFLYLIDLHQNANPTPQSNPTSQSNPT